MDRRTDSLPGFEPSPRAGGGTRVLVVLLHGWRMGPEDMGEVATAAREALGDAVDVYCPALPYASALDLTRAVAMVAALLAAVDRLVEGGADPAGPYSRIVLVGHGIGAALARRLFLAAHGPVFRGGAAAGGGRMPRDPASPSHGIEQGSVGESTNSLLAFLPEPGLDAEPARPWAARVERIVLVAAFNRGWQISARMSWSYALLFNAVGLFGHLMPGRERKPSIFDFRLGAPFMAQTRLNWLAYRRHSDTERKGPLLVQLLGSRDDLVSPLDQVDVAVDGLDRDAASPSGRGEADNASRSLYLLELAETGHGDAVALTGSAAAARRRRAVMLAFSGDRRALDGAAIDPDLLADAVVPPDTSVRRACFVIHGIRDDGFWTHRVAARIREGIGATCAASTAVRTLTPTYGYFAMLPFLLPWVRRNKVEWFMDRYVDAVALFPAASIDYVGHSNGTYLGARALRDYADCRFAHVYFAGSVVRSDFDWAGLVDAGRVGSLLNVVATADWVVALLPKSVERWRAFDLGGAGFDGFADAGRRPALAECRYVAGGHGAGIVEGHWPHIAAFVADGAVLRPDPAGAPTLFGAGQDGRIRAWADRRVALPALALAALVVVPALLCGAVWSLSHAAPASLYLLVLLVYALALAFVVDRV